MLLIKRKSAKGIWHVLSLVIAIFTLTISAAAQDSIAFKKYTYAPKKFERKMQRPNVQVLDVRTEAEYKEGHLPNAILIDVNSPEFAEKIEQLDENKTYLIYCRSGKRSEKALKLMHQAGLPNTYHLKGGYLNWKGKTEQ